MKCGRATRFETLTWYESSQLLELCVTWYETFGLKCSGLIWCELSMWYVLAELIHSSFSCYDTTTCFLFLTCYKFRSCCFFVSWFVVLICDVFGTWYDTPQTHWTGSQEVELNHSLEQLWSSCYNYVRCDVRVNLLQHRCMLRRYNVRADDVSLILDN